MSFRGMSGGWVVWLSITIQFTYILHVAHVYLRTRVRTRVLQYVLQYHGTRVRTFIHIRNTPQHLFLPPFLFRFVWVWLRRPRASGLAPWPKRASCNAGWAVIRSHHIHSCTKDADPDRGSHRAGRFRRPPAAAVDSVFARPCCCQ